jgi:hypothetical protein
MSAFCFRRTYRRSGLYRSVVGSCRTRVVRVCDHRSVLGCWSLTPMRHPLRITDAKPERRSIRPDESGALFGARTRAFHMVSQRTCSSLPIDVVRASRQRPAPPLPAHPTSRSPRTRRLVRWGIARPCSPVALHGSPLAGLTSGMYGYIIEI